MLFAPARFASRRDTIAFVTCIVLAGGARLAPEDVQFGTAEFMRETVLRPLLAIQSQIELLPTALTTAETVRWQRDTATAEYLELQRLRAENAELRKLLGLRDRQAWGPVPAEVLRQPDVSGRTLVVSAGSGQGVKPYDPVIAPQSYEHAADVQTQRPPGLLGVVQSAEANRSVVIPWTDRDWRAGAMTADGKALGIVEPGGSDGPNATLMRLTGVPFLEVVDVGTEVVTSGRGQSHGGVYPRGIFIGVVEGEEEGEVQQGWSRTYILRPAVQPIAVSHVIILTAPGDDATNGLEPDST